MLPSSESNTRSTYLLFLSETDSRDGNLFVISLNIWVMWTGWVILGCSISYFQLIMHVLLNRIYLYLQNDLNNVSILRNYRVCSLFIICTLCLVLALDTLSSNILAICRAILIVGLFLIHGRQYPASSGFCHILCINGELINSVHEIHDLAKVAFFYRMCCHFFDILDDYLFNF